MTLPVSQWKPLSYTGQAWTYVDSRGHVASVLFHNQAGTHWYGQRADVKSGFPGFNSLKEAVESAMIGVDKPESDQA